MATTAIWAIKGRLSGVINYTQNPDKTEIPAFNNDELQGLNDVMNYAMQDYKTEKRYYVSGINCFSDTAREQMMITKKRFGKTDGNMAYHGYQSFAQGELTAEIAHQIGIELAQNLWGDRYEVVVATHLDKACIHNHFVINSVSFVDGRKYNDCKATYRILRDESDRLCREYQLSVIDTPKEKGKHYSEWKAEQEGILTWRKLIRDDIDKSLSSAFTFHQFLSELNHIGYEVKTNVKYIAVRPEGKERYVRLRSLGNNYTEEAIRERILKGDKNKTLYKANIFHAFTRSSIRGLYYHYLYVLGILPTKRKVSLEEAPFFMREKQLFEYEMTREYQILVKNNINTYDELSLYKSQCNERINDLNHKKKFLQDEMQKTLINEKIKNLRKEMKDCERIAARSVEMFAEQKEYAKKKENNREERKQDDNERYS